MNDKAREFTKEIGMLCSIFRKYKLKKTLRELSEQTHVKISTLSAFEHGKSTNMELLYKYLVSCETKEQENYLIGIIVATMKSNIGGY